MTCSERERERVECNPRCLLYMCSKGGATGELTRLNNLSTQIIGFPSKNKLLY
jgi:hypothetical protein